MKVSIELDDRDVNALRTAAGEMRTSGALAAQRLLRDALIGGGWLPLGKANRSRHAGDKRR